MNRAIVEASTAVTAHWQGTSVFCAQAGIAERTMIMELDKAIGKSLTLSAMPTGRQCKITHPY